MSDINFDWIKEQLTQNKTKKAVGDAVLQLLDSWEKIKKPVKPDVSKEILDIFSKLALGHALVSDSKDEKWVPAQAGFIKVADIVRIKFDAFDSASGKNTLNGRKAKVVGIRYGDVILKSDDDKLPVLDGIHVKPDQLEKLI